MGSDLITILNQSSQGLAAFRAQAQTAGNNLQNVNTPGYSRQRVDLVSLPGQYLRTGAYLGQGVQIGAVSQSRDAFLERQIPSALAGKARYSAESDTLQAISALNPDATNGLGTAVSSFYSSLRALAQNPGDSGLRSSVLTASKQLATAFNQASSQITEAQNGVDARLSQDVNDVNDQTTAIAALNTKIAEARARGAEPNDLLDQRRIAQDKLAQLTGATAVPDSDGNVNMVLPGGISLVSGGKAATLSTIADASLDGHLRIQVQRPGTTTPDSTTATSAFGGELGGLFDARDGALAKAQDGLDTLAFSLGSALNTQHQAGVALDGSAGLALLTLPTSSAGAASGIALNAALDDQPQLLAASGTATGIPGDATNLQALVATDSQAVAGANDPAAALGAIFSSFGSSTKKARALADQDAGVADHLTKMRDSVSGVSIDEEIVAMTQAQRAFEAVSKVIQTSNEMLTTLMQLR